MSPVSWAGSFSRSGNTAACDVFTCASHICLGLRTERDQQTRRARWRIIVTVAQRYRRYTGLGSARQAARSSVTVVVGAGRICR
jgi:hypothetical protein